MQRNKKKKMSFLVKILYISNLTKNKKKDTNSLSDETVNRPSSSVGRA